MAVAGHQTRHSEGNPNITHGPGPGAGTYSGRDPGFDGCLPRQHNDLILVLFKNTPQKVYFINGGDYVFART